MSRRRHTEAKLQKFTGPFFPPAIDKLNDKLADPTRDTISVDELQTRFKRILHAKDILATILGIPFGLKTNDGYNWFATLSFETGFLFWKRTVLVSLPWSQDWDKTDGSPCDRSAAVYTSGNPKPEFIEHAIQSVIKVL